MLAGVAFALAVALGAVQLASDAIFAGAGSPYALPAHVAPNLGAAIYRGVARVAPAPYVDDMLARAALAAHNLGAARRYAARLPESANRNELLGRIALARGDHGKAQAYFLRAGDVFAIEGEVERLARRNPGAGYALEEQLKLRLERSGTHPDAVAEAYWRLGVLAARQNRLRVALENYRQAVALSPISGKYLIAAGFQAYDINALLEARGFFARAIGVDPANADAYAGAGMVALALGDRASAAAYAARSRALDPNSSPLKTLQAQLQ